MSKKNIKVFMVKYALTRGIVEVKAERDYREGVVWFLGDGYLYKNHWAHTIEEAIELAESMRLKKIESLKKQIVKFENMRFE